MLFIEYDVHPDGVIEPVALLNAVDEDGYTRGGLSEAAGGAAQREARRVISREGNRQINRFVRAIGLGPRRR
jgi:hypothetical protein